MLTFDIVSDNCMICMVFFDWWGDLGVHVNVVPDLALLVDMN